MQCLSPMSIPRPNGSGATDRIVVPCGKCGSCLSRKRQQWSFRLNQELKGCEFPSYFITLTYDSASQPYNPFNLPCFDKKGIQDFLKRLRKKLGKFRYFLVSEYGTTGCRPHYHALLFNVHADFDELYYFLLTTWRQGKCHVGTVTPKSINYVTKYVINNQRVDTSKGYDRCFTLMSRKPGLGARYVETMRGFHNADKSRMYGVDTGGKKVALPRFYRDKLYSTTTIKLNSARQQKRSELERTKRIEMFEVIKPNENFFERELEQKIDYIQKVKNKTSKLDVI